jgi:hypothetical protein
MAVGSMPNMRLCVRVRCDESALRLLGNAPSFNSKGVRSCVSRGPVGSIREDELSLRGYVGPSASENRRKAWLFAVFDAFALLYAFA